MSMHDLKDLIGSLRQQSITLERATHFAIPGPAQAILNGQYQATLREIERRELELSQMVRALVDANRAKLEKGAQSRPCH